MSMDIRIYDDGDPAPDKPLFAEILQREVELHLLRLYTGTETLERDGYPHAWHSETQAPPEWQTEPPNDGPLLLPRIPDLIREMRGHRCERCGHPYEKGDERISERGEWSPCDERCTHSHKDTRYRELMREDEWHENTFDAGVEVGQNLHDYGPGGQRLLRWEVQARWRILTVHHLDGDKANCRWWNLVALCQRCHLRMQRAVIMDRVYNFEHSEWFKPYAAGFYAFKYEGLEVTREGLDAMIAPGKTQLEHLLEYEHRFTQEAIF